jgi:hypothetical protein
LPRRLGAFDPLLRPIESDIGEQPVIEAAEVPARPPPLAPQGEDGREAEARPRGPMLSN